MAAGILANMEGKLGIRAWRWCVHIARLECLVLILSTIFTQAVLYRGTLTPLQYGLQRMTCFA